MPPLRMPIEKANEFITLKELSNHAGNGILVNGWLGISFQILFKRLLFRVETV